MLINKNEYFEVKRSGIPKMNPLGSEYRSWWKEQKYRCINGYSVGGQWIPGKLYFYGNFWNILMKNPSNPRRKTKGLPDISELEWRLALLFDEAKNEPNALRVVEGRQLITDNNLYRPEEDGTKGILLMGPRDSGKSFFSSAIVGHEYSFYKDNYCGVSASEGKYSKDLMAKIRFGLDNLGGATEYKSNGITKQKPSPFSHRRIKKDWNVEVRSGYTENGDDKILGYNSVIQHIIYEFNEMAANGKRYSVQIMEEIGAWNNAPLIECFDASLPCWKDDTTWFGVPILQGTGGNMEGGTTDAKKMFYNPDAYNLLAFEDKWEGKGRICYFIPNSLGARQFKDPKTGLVDYPRADAHFRDTLDKKMKDGSDKRSILNYRMYYPFVPSDMFIKKNASIMPVRELADWLSYIENNADILAEERHGWIDPFFEFQEDPNMHPLNFPVTDVEDRAGCVSIYEMPVENIPEGLYIAATDPYDQDDSLTDSLGSTKVYKRFLPGQGTYDTLVASYTGRPDKSEDYYEQTRRLLTIYKAVDMYENQLRGFYTFMKNKHCLHLLAEQPEFLKDIIKDMRVTRGYGIHMTAGIRKTLEIYAKDWLLTEYDIGKFNYMKIRDRRLLAQLIAYDGEGNFDDVDAFLILMGFVVELTGNPVNDILYQVQEGDDFWNRDLFKRA